MSNDSNKCTCGNDGLHPHNIDGKSYLLCGLCHAAVKVLLYNHFGWPITRAIEFAYSRGDDEPNIFETYAQEEPSSVPPALTESSTNKVHHHSAVASPSDLSFYEVSEAFEEERVPPNI